MLITLAGSLVYSPEFPVPGVDIYALRFNVDYSVIDSGCYDYGPNTTHRLNTPDSSTLLDRPNVRRMDGRELGLKDFYTLTLCYRLHSGKIIEKTIAIKPLVDALVESVTIPNLRDSEHGGGAALVVDVSDKKVALSYHLHQDFNGPQGQYYFKTHVYPLADLTVDA